LTAFAPASSPIGGVFPLGTHGFRESACRSRVATWPQHVVSPARAGQNATTRDRRGT
jgi:hypothetical protein